MDTVTSADGTRIAFDRSGEGPALILVAGALSTREGAAEIAVNLAPSFTAIGYDRRGRGDSGDVQPYAPEREIEDISALIDMLGGSAFVFGHSSGSVLALKATAAGLPIPKLAMYEPPFIVSNIRPPQPDEYTEHLDALLAAGRRGDAVAYFFTDSVGVPASAVDEMRADPDWAEMEALAHTIAYDGRVMGDTMRGSAAPLAQWASMATPTLIADGGASYPFMRSAADALAAVLPNAERRTLPGQGHGAAPEVMVPVLVDFFGR